MPTDHTMPSNLPYWIPAYYVTTYYYEIGDKGDPDFQSGYSNGYNAALNPAFKDIGIFFPQNDSQLPEIAFQRKGKVIPFNLQTQEAVWAGLRTLEGLIDVQFKPANESDLPGVINYFQTSTPGASGLGLTMRTDGCGLVMISDEYVEPASRTAGGVLVHETMHALGLNHPYEQATYRVQPEDNGHQWTTLSNSVTDTRDVPPGFFEGETFMPRLLDIAALQYLYGPSKSVRTGNDTYKLVENDTNFIWDAIGTDTIDGQHLTKGLTLDLNPGTWGHIGAKATFITAPGQVTVNYGSTIENVLGTNFDDAITGNSAGNVLKGFGGNDRFTLATGNDTVDGGTGTDTVVLSGVRGSYAASKTGDTVRFTSTTDGTKALTGVERVLFNHGTDATAYDIANGGIAGETIKLLAVAAGTAMVANKDIAGVGIAFRDAGMTRDQVSEAAINAVVGVNGTNADVVRVLWTNLVGSAPSAADAQPFVDMLNHGDLTRGSLTSLAADVLDQNVHLTGVASYEYTVFAV